MKAAAVLRAEERWLPVVLQCWREVLGTQTISEDSHFFLCGGDSLALTRVLLRVRQQLQVELQLHDLVQFSTPRKMARWCWQLGVQDPVPAVMPATEERQSFVASQSQQGLWLSEIHADNVGLYNSGLLLRLRGPLKVAVLAQALAQVLRQHPLLRSSLQFHVSRKSLLVEIAEAASGNDTVPLTSESLPVSALAATAATFVAAPFVFAERLLRWRLFRLRDVADTQHVLLLGCHHCIFDGWSGGVLLQSLGTAYNGLLRDPHWQSDTTDSAFAAHCQHEQQFLQANDWQPRVHWWRQQLRGFVVPTLLSPPWQGTAEQWPYRWQQLCVPLSSALMQQLATASAERGATLFSCLLLVLQQVLLLTGGQRDYCIGFPVAGRTTLAEETSVGCYMQLLFVRLPVAEAGLPEVLQQVHADVVAAQTHALPLPLLLQALRPTTLPDGNAWFDVVLALQNFPMGQPQFAELDCRAEALPTVYGQYPLKFEVSVASTGYQLEISYAETVLPAALVAHMADEFGRGLQRLADGLATTRTN